MQVFVDYDGTLTDEDTLDALARIAAGEAVFDEIDGRLARGEIKLRDALAEQLSYVRLSLDEADALLRTIVTFDPSFADFVETCRQHDAAVTVLSSGVDDLIARMLARNGLAHIPIIANSVDFQSSGWRMRFRDKVPNGTDKAGIVRAAGVAGSHTVFVGDGYSDYDAALVADTRFAKRGRALERFLEERGIEFSPFSAFSEITAALFPES